MTIAVGAHVAPLGGGVVVGHDEDEAAGLALLHADEIAGVLLAIDKLVRAAFEAAAEDGDGADVLVARNPEDRL